jgi:hypothetical protein
LKAKFQIGYLNADLAEEIAKHIDSGGRVECIISEVTGGVRGKSTRGVNVLLTKS